jgi:hypothetical protein
LGFVLRWVAYGYRADDHRSPALSLGFGSVCCRVQPPESLPSEDFAAPMPVVQQMTSSIPHDSPRQGALRFASKAGVRLRSWYALLISQLRTCCRDLSQQPGCLISCSLFVQVIIVVLAHTNLKVPPLSTTRYCSPPLAINTAAVPAPAIRGAGSMIAPNLQPLRW